MSNICYNCFRETPGGVCPVCGFDPARDEGKYPHALPYGTVLGGKYITGRVLGQGGFGITYISQDYKTRELVAIKEFFPDTMVTRGATNSAVPFSERQNGDFTYGKTTFLEEAKTLAQFNGHPNIVGVKSYFEENGTAYFSMEYVEGASLQSYVNAHGGKLTWEETAAILLPVMDALGTVHAKGIIHRDIKPDNIFINNTGVVKLLDFGSARYSMGEKSRSLDVILTHGFAPKEQYSRHGRQGAYTDIYALAATWYYTLTGRKPPDSIDRVDEDDLIPPSTLGVRISETQEDALLKALAVSPADRYQTMGDFRAAMVGTSSEPPKPPEPPEPPDPPKPEPKKLPKWLLPVIGAAAVVVIVLAVALGGRSGEQPGEDVTLAAGSTEVSVPEPVSAEAPNPEETPETTPSQPPADLSGAVIGVPGAATEGGETGESGETGEMETVSLQTKATFYNDDGSVDDYYEYEYNEYGEETKWTVFNPDGSVDYWHEYVFDDQGNEIEDIDYNADGSVDGRYVRTFDDRNHVLTSHSYDETGEVEWWFEYFYDDQGNEIKMIDHDGSGDAVDDWCERFYDANGNEIKYISYNGDGSVDYWRESTYDSGGNEIGYTRYNADGSVSSSHEYTYDADGNQTSHISYKADGSRSSMFVSTYDARGNKTRSEYYSGDSTEPDGVDTYEYAYDIDGNMLKRTGYENGQLYSVREYIVTQVKVRDTAS